MKVFKLKGLELYAAAQNIVDARFIFIANKMGVVSKEDIEQTSIKVKDSCEGLIFKDLKSFEDLIFKAK
jgi:hypothetical protein